jgi:glycosyltransferase involved in cell wall biosynthesis
MNRVLHICNGFAGRALFAELVKALDENQLNQWVFAPVRAAASVDRNRDAQLSGVEYFYPHVLRQTDRILFRRKVRNLCRVLKTRWPLDHANVVHAHTWYSDGAVALGLKRQYGLPYIVSVRNTDVNVFERWRPDLARLGRAVLEEAAAVVFLNPAYAERVAERCPESGRQRLREKTHVIPNGVSEVWCAEQAEREEREGEQLRLLYVGDFSRNKNLPRLIEAVDRVARERPTGLTLVGGGGGGALNVERLIRSGAVPFVRREGRVESRRDLMRIYRAHDIFVMPSLHESFGLVYVEALSQGLPIVHSRGEGVAGYFEPDTVAEAVDPRSVESIVAGIEALSKRRRRVVKQCVEEAKRFSWVKVAARLSALYEMVAADYGTGGARTRAGAGA